MAGGLSASFGQPRSPAHSTEVLLTNNMLETLWALWSLRAQPKCDDFASTTRTNNGSKPSQQRAHANDDPQVTWPCRLMLRTTEGMEELRGKAPALAGPCKALLARRPVHKRRTRRDCPAAVSWPSPGRT